jgi:hypothetical protein
VRKYIHHDHLWKEVPCTDHGKRNCMKLIRIGHDEEEHHFRIKEPKPATTTGKPPPCIGCRGNKALKKAQTEGK